MPSSHHHFCNCKECMLKYEIESLRRELQDKIRKAVDEYEAKYQKLKGR